MSGVVRARKGHWIPWIFVGGFFVVVAANGALVLFSIGTFSGLTTTEPYTKGLRFNDTLRLAETQRRLGWRIATHIDRSRPQYVSIDLVATERDGAPLLGAQVSAEIVRPLERAHDFAAVFEDAGRGRHQLSLALPHPGQWEVRYRIRRNGDLAEIRERFQVGATQ